MNINSIISILSKFEQQKEQVKPFVTVNLVDNTNFAPRYIKKNDKTKGNKASSNLLATHERSNVMRPLYNKTAQ